MEKKRGENNETEVVMAMPEWWEQTNEGGRAMEINVTKTMFVDDHLEVHKLQMGEGRKRWTTEWVKSQVREIAGPFFEAQEEVGVESLK